MPRKGEKQRKNSYRTDYVQSLIAVGVFLHNDIFNYPHLKWNPLLCRDMI